MRDRELVTIEEAIARIEDPGLEQLLVPLN